MNFSNKPATNWRKREMFGNNFKCAHSFDGCVYFQCNAPRIPITKLCAARIAPETVESDQHLPFEATLYSAIIEKNGARENQYNAQADSNESAHRRIRTYDNLDACN